MAAVEAPALVCGHCGRRYGLRFQEALGKVTPHEGRCDICRVSTLVVEVGATGGLRGGWEVT